MQNTKFDRISQLAEYHMLGDSKGLAPCLAVMAFCELCKQLLERLPKVENVKDNTTN